MNFDLYRIFYTVGKHQSITQAARELYVTQPSVTHAIHTLEKSLNCPLFLRTRKGVTFTHEGQTLFNTIAQACETMMQAEKKIESLKNLSEGLLKIGASETTLHHFLMPALTTFKQRHPQIHLKIFNSSTPAMLQALLQETIDFAVLVLKKDSMIDDFEITPLSDFQDVLIVSSEFSFFKDQLLHLENLMDYPLITLEKNTASRNFFEEVFQSQNLDPEPDIELATTDLIVPMVTAGLGIGFVPEFFTQNALEEGTILKLNIQDSIPKRDICLVKKKKAPLSLTAEAFIQSLISNK